MLTVISWNVYVRHNVEDVHHQLGQMIHEHQPDVILLYEAKHLHGHLTGLGYNVSHLSDKKSPSKHHKGNVRGASNVAILTRSTLKRKGVFSLVMSKFWKGPHLGAMQDPRVYRWTRIEKDGVIWKIGGFHIPFGQEARHESITAICRWFNATISGRPVIALGDFNLPRSIVVSAIANRVGAQVSGEGIDDAVYMRCQIMAVHDIGHHGSDHPAMLYKFEPDHKRR